MSIFELVEELKDKRSKINLNTINSVSTTIINIQLKKLQKCILIPFLFTLPIVHNLLIFVYIILAVLFTLLRLPICNVFKGIKLYAYIVGSYSSVS